MHESLALNVLFLLFCFVIGFLFPSQSDSSSFSSLLWMWTKALINIFGSVQRKIHTHLLWHFLTITRDCAGTETITSHEKVYVGHEPVWVWHGGNRTVMHSRDYNKVMIFGIRLFYSDDSSAFWSSSTSTCNFMGALYQVNPVMTLSENQRQK